MRALFARACRVLAATAVVAIGMSPLPALAYTGTGDASDPIVLVGSETYTKSGITYGYDASGWFARPTAKNVREIKMLGPDNHVLCGDNYMGPGQVGACVPGRSYPTAGTSEEASFQADFNSANSTDLWFKRKITPAPKDLCANVDGIQETIPADMVADGVGGCRPLNDTPVEACVFDGGVTPGGYGFFFSGTAKEFADKLKASGYSWGIWAPVSYWDGTKVVNLGGPNWDDSTENFWGRRLVANKCKPTASIVPPLDPKINEMCGTGSDEFFIPAIEHLYEIHWNAYDADGKLLFDHWYAYTGGAVKYSDIKDFRIGEKPHTYVLPAGTTRVSFELLTHKGEAWEQTGSQYWSGSLSVSTAGCVEPPPSTPPSTPPTTPVVPGAPTEPATPTTPTQPGTPTTPLLPGKPATPAPPSTPILPAAPVTPTAPVPAARPIQSPQVGAVRGASRTPAVPSASLPYTGAEVGSMTLLGAAFLGAGLLLLILRRRSADA